MLVEWVALEKCAHWALQVQQDRELGLESSLGTNSCHEGFQPRPALFSANADCSASTMSLTSLFALTKGCQLALVWNHREILLKHLRGDCPGVEISAFVWWKEAFLSNAPWGCCWWWHIRRVNMRKASSVDQLTHLIKISIGVLLQTLMMWGPFTLDFFPFERLPYSWHKLIWQFLGGCGEGGGACEKMISSGSHNKFHLSQIMDVIVTWKAICSRRECLMVNLKHFHLNSYTHNAVIHIAISHQLNICYSIGIRTATGWKITRMMSNNQDS